MPDLRLRVFTKLSIPVNSRRAESAAMHCSLNLSCWDECFQRETGESVPPADVPRLCQHKEVLHQVIKHAFCAALRAGPGGLWSELGQQAELQNPLT
jgi:hypothetical protein